MSELDDQDEPTESFWGQLDEQAAEPADWSGDELESAYLRAMEALEASDAEFSQLPPVLVPLEADEQTNSDGDNPEFADEPPAASVPLIIAAAGTEAADDRISSEELNSELASLSDAATQQMRPMAPAIPPAATISPRQILEALLFVGGEPLTTRKLGNVLRGEFSAEFIESELDALNRLYVAEGRPYEIRLGEGGYRLTLREDFERFRRKVFGLGPKEIKLSQEAIEVLALIAYHQPATIADIDQLGKPGCSAVVRQLVQRELVSVERNTERPQQAVYKTTPRFLSLFGIRSLAELPRLEQVAYK